MVVCYIFFYLNSYTVIQSDVGADVGADVEADIGVDAMSGVGANVEAAVGVDAEADIEFSYWFQLLGVLTERAKSSMISSGLPKAIHCS